MSESENEVIDGSGNIFADLGLPCSDEDMLKAGIARVIAISIQKRNINQTEAAKLIETDQARVSNLLRGKLEGFSTERLLRMLALLGRDVDIRISDQKRRTGRIRINEAA